MERILLIMGNMGLGGAETHIMKVYRAIDREQYQFDFVLNVPEKCYYEDEILALGGRTYRVTPKTESVLKNYRQIKALVKEHGYRIVLKCGEQAMSWTEMLAAKQGGAEKRIMRSTNSKGSESRLGKWLHAISRYPLCSLTTHKVAPSQLAGEWLFGSRGCRELILVNNGIDLDQYAYSADRRGELRRELDIPQEALVMGHVGRFNEQKNHRFLLELFAAWHALGPDRYLLLIGDGPLRQEIEDRAKALHLTEHIRFAGNRADANLLYSAMDMFVFPSWYEGMPNTVIEAQANGLKCLVADTITRAADITGDVTYLPLEGTEPWLKELGQTDPAHHDTAQAFIRAGYDIASVVKVYEAMFKDC